VGVCSACTHPPALFGGWGGGWGGGGVSGACFKEDVGVRLHRCVVACFEEDMCDIVMKWVQRCVPQTLQMYAPFEEHCTLT
jgi:hypothetical protein